MRSRLLASLLVLVAMALSWRSARADTPRPLDAPLRASKRSMEDPPLPDAYTSLEIDGIRFSYHPSTLERVGPLLKRVGAIRATLSALVGAAVLGNVDVRVAAVPAAMVSLAPGDVPATASSVAFFDPSGAAAPLIVMSAFSSSSSPDLESALTHALAHVALDEATNAADVPVWFHEGFAFNVAESSDLSMERALVNAAVFGRFLTLDELSAAVGQGDLGAAQAGDFVRFLAASRDPRSTKSVLAGVLQRLKNREPFDRAIETELGGADRATVEARWSDDRARRYAFLPAIVVLLTAAGIVAGVWIAVGRSRRAKVAAAAANARARKERRDATPRPARAPAKVTAAARLAAGRGRDAAIHVMREPDVPKVEHNGEWHTLH